MNERTRNTLSQKYIRAHQTDEQLQMLKAIKRSNLLNQIQPQEIVSTIAIH